MSTNYEDSCNGFNWFDEYLSAIPLKQECRIISTENTPKT